MRGATTSGSILVIAISLALVWAEAAAVAIWAPMDFLPGPDLPWPRAVPAGWPAHPDRVMTCGARGLRGEWYTGHGPEPVDPLRNPTLYRLVEMRVGWPAQTFRFERTLVLADARGTLGWTMDEPASVWTGGLPIQRWMPKPDEAPTGAPSIRRIPLRPLWGGMFVAALAHAGALAGMILALGQVRGRIRSAMGRCAGCGYELRGLDAGTPCPECGLAKAGLVAPSREQLR